MKKLLTLTLAVLAVFLLCSAVYAEDNTDYQRQLDFIEYFNITDGISHNPDEEITRAEFTAMVVRAINMQDMNSIDNSFVDVGNTAPFAKEIYVAKALRITNGTSADTFSPNNNIAPVGAAKMLVIALGYETMAEYQGSYPVGYVTMASRLDLTAGLSMDGSTLRYRDAVALIYNTLHAYPADYASISGDGIEYRADSKNVIESKFKLNFTSGVISTAGYMGENASFTGADIIEINGKEFSANSDIFYYIGYSAEVYYDDSRNVIAIDIGSDNKSIVIDTKDIEDFTSYTLDTVTEEGKTKKYSLDPSFTYLKNGRSAGFNINDIKSADGSVTIIDNDGDGRYEYMLSMLGRYFKIDRLNKSNFSISDNTYRNETVYTDESDGYEAIIRAYDEESGRYIKADFSKLAEGSIVFVHSSDDGKLNIIYTAGKKSVTGVLEAIGDDYLIIDGKSYEINSYYTGMNLNPSPGGSYSFTLANDGTIGYISLAGESTAKYGYLMDVGFGTGLDSGMMLKLFSHDGSVVTADLAKKVKLDGVSMSNTDTRLKDKLYNGDKIQYQLVKYILSDSGELTSIDTASSVTLLSSNIQKGYDQYDSLTAYALKKHSQYSRPGEYLMQPNFILKGSIIINAPKGIGSGTYEEYDDKDFEIITASAIPEWNASTIDVFDVDSVHCPAIIVIYNKDAGALSLKSTSEYDTEGLVYKITDSVDEDGNNVKKVYVQQGTKSVEYKLSKEISDALANDTNANKKVPKIGDIARFRVDSDNNILGVYIDAHYNPMTKDAAISFGDSTNSNISENYVSILGYIGGKLVNVNNGVILMKLDDNKKPAGSGYVETIENFAVQHLSSDSCVVFNRRTEEVSIGKVADYINYSDDYFAICRATYAKVQNTYVYID